MMKLGIYQHSKGQYYQVLGLCRHSETLETMVVYQALYSPFGLWVRPHAMFQEHVLHQGETIPRFRWVSLGVASAPIIHKNE